MSNFVRYAINDFSGGLCLGLQLFGQEIALPDTLRTKGSLADTVQLSGASVSPQEAFYHQPPYGGVVSINI